MTTKISLIDAAEQNGCSTDYLLALAEAGKVSIFASVRPFTGRFKNALGEAPVAFDGLGRPLKLASPQTVGGISYTTLIDVEAAWMRSGQPLIIRVLRIEGDENGVRFPFSGDEEYSLHLDQPQTVTLEHLFVNEEYHAAGTARRLAVNGTTGADPIPAKPISRSASQDNAILFGIRVLGMNPLALQTSPQGTPGARALVRESLRRQDPKAYSSIFISNKVFETAWQRLRDAGQIADAQPTPLYPPRK